jgi:hypothetical protein
LAISASVIEPALENDVKSAFSAGSWRLEIHDGGTLADLADDVVAVGLTLGACPTPRGAAALGTVLGLRQNKSESKSKSLSNWYLLCFVVVIVVPFSLPPPRTRRPDIGLKSLKPCRFDFELDTQTLKKTH